MISKLVLNILKEFAETVLRTSKKLLSNNTNKLSDEYTDLKNRGISFVPNFYSLEKCSQLRDKIDNVIDSGKYNIWVDEEGADKRIYFANEIDDLFNEFYRNEQLRQYLKEYTGIKEPVGMLLASRIEFKEGNKGSGAGWHRDSPITHQFKAVCYLNKVTEDNGPFEYIEGSHKKRNIFKAYLRKIFEPQQYRFSDEQIEKYQNSLSTQSTLCIGNEGAVVLSDTKGIHRGSPLKLGKRYVLFCYFWEKKIPDHFEKLRQK